ncbi:MAG: cytochrome c class I [Ferruginibacter sp.]|nr:cytochrome c class I [Ferruginibacter sp.]
MKKITACAFLVFTLLACNSSNDKKDSSTEKKDNNTAMDNPDYDAGLNLVAKSDCFTCHKLREPLVGPAYGDIAKKYENTPENISMLADRVINGSSGQWGEVQMLPHRDLKKEDAEKMVKYILLLKN